MKELTQQYVICNDNEMNVLKQNERNAHEKNAPYRRYSTNLQNKMNIFYSLLSLRYVRGDPRQCISRYIPQGVYAADAGALNDSDSQGQW